LGQLEQGEREKAAKRGGGPSRPKVSPKKKKGSKGETLSNTEPVADGKMGRDLSKPWGRVKAEAAKGFTQGEEG